MRVGNDCITTEENACIVQACSPWRGLSENYQRFESGNQESRKWAAMEVSKQEKIRNLSRFIVS